MLTWDDSFALARILMERFSEINLNTVSLEKIYQWVIDLPEFSDDHELVNDDILCAIYREWFEEANPL